MLNCEYFPEKIAGKAEKAGKTKKKGAFHSTAQSGRKRPCQAVFALMILRKQNG